MEAGFKNNLNMHDENTIRIFDILGSDEGSIRFIGGCVRDFLLDKEINDIDISTIHKPEIVIEKLNRSNIKTIPTGIKFGTITALFGNKSYEITTLRKDIECNGRHAIVAFTDDWFSDASRRDFTINALSYNKNIFDYFNGIDDLKNKKVRFIGDPYQRIKEDYLRILRFFRFSLMYSDNFDDESLNIIKILGNNLEKISGERIQSELIKIMDNPNSYIFFDYVNKFSLHQYLGITDHIDVYLYNNLYKAEKLLGIEYDYILRIFILAKDDIENFSKRWKLPNRIKNEIILIDKYAYKFDIKDIKSVKDIVFEIGVQNFIKLIVIYFAIDIENFKFYSDLISLINNFVYNKFPLENNDIIDMGFIGKDISRIISIAKNYWIVNDYDIKKECIIKYIKSLSQF